MLLQYCWLWDLKRTVSPFGSDGNGRKLYKPAGILYNQRHCANLASRTFFFPLHWKDYGYFTVYLAVRIMSVPEIRIKLLVELVGSWIGILSIWIFFQFNSIMLELRFNYKLCCIDTGTVLYPVRIQIQSTKILQKARYEYVIYIYT